MKLLHAVARYCGIRARDVSGRGAVVVPRDFRVTVPAPLPGTPAPGADTIPERRAMDRIAANQSLLAVSMLVTPRH
ncbi:MAG: hypothetical protein ABI386_13025 [Rhodanobacter sp.]